MDNQPIELLRNAFAQSSVATLATQLGAYLNMMAHPDVCFSDLLDALDRGAVIGDDAAARLHRRMQLPSHLSRPIAQVAFWEQVLRERGIDPAMPFYGPRIPVNPVPPPAGGE